MGQEEEMPEEETQYTANIKLGKTISAREKKRR